MIFERNYFFDIFLASESELLRFRDVTIVAGSLYHLLLRVIVVVIFYATICVGQGKYLRDDVIPL